MLRSRRSKEKPSTMRSVKKQIANERIKTKRLRLPLLLRYLQLVSINFIFLTATPTHAATTARTQLMHQQLRSLSPAQLLREYSETLMPANTSRADFIESSIDSWTARTLVAAKKLQRLEQQQQQQALRQQHRAQKRKKQQEEQQQQQMQQQQQQQQQQHSQPNKSHKHEKSRKQREHHQTQQQRKQHRQTHHQATRRKTKSGLAIESNINSNEFVADNIALADATNAAAVKATTSAFAVNTNKRGTSTQQQKKKNGRNGNGNGNGGGGGGGGGNYNGGSHNGHGIRDVGGVGGGQRQKLHRN
ncbi:PREDICTED: ras guanine nucleotide exchange factor B-like, partial [Rhagoletis zephyria]|uniref:ras guanine nucleotide exchange factor B-like n=1 Tax=Rhagoletis zephyria TaxID=28612 RepID=UPI0008113956